MRKLSILVASALTFGLAPFAPRLGVVGGSAALVALGILLAVAASGGVYALAIACGALAALGGSILGTVSPTIAGALLITVAYAERTSRVRGAAPKLIHIAAAGLGGGLAGMLASSYASATAAVHGVSIVVGAVLVALPMLLEADDALAHSLDGAAAEIEGPAKASLKEGAEIRRHSHEVPLDRSAALHVKKTWNALLKLANARVRLEKTRSRAEARAQQSTSTEPYRLAAGSTAESVVAMVDQRIGDHVKALSRAYAAVDTARAAAVGLDDAALKGALSVGESMDEVSKAIVEVK